MCEDVDHRSEQEENEETVSGQEKLQQNNEDENKVADKPEWEVEKTTESRNEVSTSEWSSPAFWLSCSFVTVYVENEFCT